MPTSAAVDDILTIDPPPDALTDMAVVRKTVCRQMIWDYSPQKLKETFAV